MATVSKASIEAKIKSVYYINAGRAIEEAYGDALLPGDYKNLSLVTVCIIILENGFKVEGTSACVDPANFNEVLGQEAAYENAFNKIWEIEGYLLRQSMYETEQSQAMLRGFQENDSCTSGGCTI